MISDWAPGPAKLGPWLRTHKAESRCQPGPVPYPRLGGLFGVRVLLAEFYSCGHRFEVPFSCVCQVAAPTGPYSSCHIYSLYKMTILRLSFLAENLSVLKTFPLGMPSTLLKRFT